MRVTALALLLIATGIAQAAAQPFVRVEMKPAQIAPVGQQIRVGVTVLAPNFFLSSPQFPLFDIPGAIVVLPDETALNSTETINGQTYAGIRRDYLITPQRAGDFTLPPAEIAFSYAAELGKPGVAGSVNLPPQKFTAELPQGAKASASLVTEVVVTQTIEGDPKSMKVGDALPRTVETFAPNTQAMMIPPPTFTAPLGVRVYPRDPVLSDVISDRGVFIGGRRVDQATYVFEQKGAYSLSAIEVPWYDAQMKRQEVSATPEINVSIGEAPPSPSDLAPPSPTDALSTTQATARVDWRRPLIAAVGLAVLVFGGFWTLKPLAARVAIGRGRAVRRKKRQKPPPSQG